MIASLRGLVVLAAIAAALLVILVVARPASPVPLDRTLVPGFVAARVSALELAGPGRAQRIERSGEQWRIDGAIADPATVDALLAALRGARWHRRAAAPAAGPPRVQLRVLTGTDAATFAIGNPLIGAGQTWVTAGGRAFLVDDWVVHALAPEPIALHIRHPLAEVASARDIAISQPPLRIQGSRRVEPVAVWLEPARLQAFYDACAALDIVELAPPSPAIGPSITIDAVRVERAGTCANDRVLVVATQTTGCVERVAWDRLEAAVAALARPAEQIADPRPLPFVPTRLTVAGTPLDLHAVDPERLQELVSALATPAAIVPRPTTKPTATIVAGDASAQVALELYPSGSIGRSGEPIALRPTREAWAIIARPATALRDPTRWHEDPTTISSLSVDGVTYQRGAVLGEWTRQPTGAVDPALVDALVEALASVRAPTAAPPASIAHRIAFTVTPPVGKPISHTIELGAPSTAGCAARIDGAPALVLLPLCTAALAVAGTR